MNDNSKQDETEETTTSTIGIPMCGMCYFEHHRDNTIEAWDIGVGCWA
jgi:hypothetical protein